MFENLYVVFKNPVFFHGGWGRFTVGSRVTISNPWAYSSCPLYHTVAGDKGLGLWLFHQLKMLCQPIFFGNFSIEYLPQTQLKCFFCQWLCPSVPGIVTIYKLFFILPDRRTYYTLFFASNTVAHKHTDSHTHTHINTDNCILKFIHLSRI